MASYALDRVRPRVGDLAQLASVRLVRLQDGPEDGVRALDVRVAGGLHALVLADRGMDLGPVWHRGLPLAWISPTGIVHPAFTETDGWLRSFHGGLLATCGLQNVGAPCCEDGARHGLHGHASNTPARAVSWEVRETGTGIEAIISGTVRDTSVYGDDLVLRRTLRFPVGSPRVQINDAVENRGFASAPLMLLYHINLGWPVVDDDARFVAPDRVVRPHDEASARCIGEHATVGPPQPDAGPELYEHRLEPPPEIARVGVVNPSFTQTGGLGVAISYRPSQLPRLWHWRMRARGTYLTGIEPANCGVEGRVSERRAGAVEMIDPGRHREFAITIEALDGQPAMDFLETQGTAALSGLTA